VSASAGPTHNWSSCAYVYLDKFEDNLPPRQSAELRMKGLE
jgi:hypothetical protein